MWPMGFEPTPPKLGQESESCASAIPPLPHGNFIYSNKIRGKSQLPGDNSPFLGA